jgi:hypothetical protein
MKEWDWGEVGRTTTKATPEELAKEGSIYDKDGKDTTHMFYGVKRPEVGEHNKLTKTGTTWTHSKKRIGSWNEGKQCDWTAANLPNSNKIYVCTKHETKSMAINNLKRHHRECEEYWSEI